MARVLAEGCPDQSGAGGVGGFRGTNRKGSGKDVSAGRRVARGRGSPAGAAAETASEAACSRCAAVRAASAWAACCWTRRSSATASASAASRATSTKGISAGSRVTQASAPISLLSPREQEVARMVASGYPNKTIALVLEISSRTVASHLRRIFMKLNVSSRVAMAARLTGSGLSELSLSNIDPHEPVSRRRVRAGKSEHKQAVPGIQRRLVYSAGPATRGAESPGRHCVVNADGGQFAAKSLEAARPVRPNAANRHIKPGGRVCISAGGRDHQAGEQSPVLYRQPVKSRSHLRVPVPCHHLILRRVISVRRVEVLSLFDRKLSPAVSGEHKALPAGGRSQPPADRAWLAQRAEVLNQA